MKAKMFVVVLLCAVLLSSGVACCAGEAPPMLAEEIRDEAIAVDAELDTYQFEMEMTMVMGMTMMGETFQMAMVMDAEGAIDYLNETLYVDMTMTAEVTGEEDMEMSMAVYIVEDWMYMGEQMPGEAAVWQKVPLPEEMWAQYDLVAQQLDALSDADVEFVRNETVGGAECYVLDVTPDIEKLWALTQLGGAGEGLLPVPNLEELISDFSVRYWIAQDTYFIRKTTADITMVLTPEALGIPPELAGELDAAADIATTITMRHINEPVSIELPPEAEEAEEVSML